MFCPSPPSLEDCRWFGQEILEPYRSVVAMTVATEPSALTMILPDLTPGRGLWTVASCTLSNPGLWAGPVTRKIE
jgi:hypothetical protein